MKSKRSMQALLLALVAVVGISVPMKPSMHTFHRILTGILVSTYTVPHSHLTLPGNLLIYFIQRRCNDEEVSRSHRSRSASSRSIGRCFLYTAYYDSSRRGDWSKDYSRYRAC